MTFGKKLETLLKEKGITQTKFAELFNPENPKAGQVMISKYIHNQTKKPSKETIEKFAQILDIPINILLNDICPFRTVKRINELIKELNIELDTLKESL